MSLRKNILANCFAQAYVTVIAVAMIPQYILYMGTEAYGLVGFFAFLQAWFNLLDMGLTPTIARETARFKGGATSPLQYRRLVRALEGVFVAVAIAGATLLLMSSDFLATRWLNAELLPASEVALSLNIIAVVIALRWLCGLYRGVVSGAERLVWLSSYNSVIASLRFVGVLPALILLDPSPTTFFLYQLIIAVFELTILASKAYQLLPPVEPIAKVRWAWAPLKPVLKFSLTVAFTSSVWVLVTQTDKLVLSKILSLSDYGYFTLAVLVANGIMVISGPISSAIMPRMTRLEAEGDLSGLISLYRRATQWVTICAGSVAVTLAVCAEPLLRAWTGDSILAAKASPVLTLYALGNGILVVGAFPYYLQYAKGDLRLHLIGNALFVILIIPAIIWAAEQYGAVGAGYVWLGMNALSFAAWLPWVHRKLAPNLNSTWYGRDVLVIFVPMLAAGLFLQSVMRESEDRLLQVCWVLMLGLGVLLVGVLFSSEAKEKVKTLMGQRWQNQCM